MAKLLGNPVIDERYTCVKRIGHGGTSYVYLVKDKRLDKEWAVKKVLRKDKRTDVFLEEADMLKQLDHPTLPRIIDIVTDEKAFYIVMDYIEGEDLGAMLKRQGPSEQSTVIKWGLILTEVLSYLHSKGIIYRDMKPSNIMITKDGNIKLVDFGIARFYKEGQENDTNFIGTEGYAPPEQFKKQSDARSDVYSLGMTLFELFTGEDPRGHTGDVYSVRAIDPSLSSGIDHVIRKATNKNPEERFQSAKAFNAALAEYRKYDERYVKRRRDVMKIFHSLLIASAICAVLSASLFLYDTYMKNKEYSALLSGRPTKEAAKQAIEMKPEDARGYIALLNSYDGMDAKEMSEFSYIYGETGQSIPEVDYAAGEKILMDFEESDRGKLKFAYPYFKRISGDNKNAKMYCELAEFIETYMKDDGLLSENASKKDYENLLDTISECISVSNASDKENLRNSVQEICSGVLYQKVEDFKRVKVPEEKVLNVAEKMDNKDELKNKIKAVYERKEEEPEVHDVNR